MRTADKGSSLTAIARGLAFFVGSYSLLNIVGDLRRAGFDANHWWIDLRPIPPAGGRIILVAASLALLLFAVRPTMRGPMRTAVIASAGLLLGLVAWNIATFYRLMLAGIVAAFPVPLSAFVFGALVIILWALRREPVLRRRHMLLSLATVAAAALGFPLLQMVCFGKTDYRRPADVAVVFGARTYANGSPSNALTYRVRTACGLYRDRLVNRLILSGGPGDGAVHETAAMRTLALSLGVAEEDIILDPEGLSTRLTVRNTVPILSANGCRRVIAVSDFYHLPRIKMTYQRAGVEVWTVPAQGDPLAKLPYFMLREVAALWAYYLGPLLG